MSSNMLIHIDFNPSMDKKSYAQKVWDEITYLVPNFNAYIHFMMDVITIHAKNKVKPL